MYLDTKNQKNRLCIELGKMRLINERKYKGMLWAVLTIAVVGTVVALLLFNLATIGLPEADAFAVPN